MTTQAPASYCHRPAPFVLWRLSDALRRRLRLLWNRVRHPRVSFGPRCDVRPGLELNMGPGAVVRIGRDCVLDKQMTLEVDGTLEIGERTIFGHHCTIAARSHVVIGDDCLIAEMVSIRDHDHCIVDADVLIREQGAVIAPVRIGRNVWIGAKATVVKGVTIGDNTVIGANAVVTTDIPANVVAGGIPARVLRVRGGAP